MTVTSKILSNVHIVIDKIHTAGHVDAASGRMVYMSSGVGRCFQLGGGGGGGLALWCLTDQSSSIQVGAGGRLPRGKKFEIR